jgi:hypothetical protein
MGGKSAHQQIMRARFKIRMMNLGYNTSTVASVGARTRFAWSPATAKAVPAKTLRINNSRTSIIRTTSLWMSGERMFELAVIPARRS